MCRDRRSETLKADTSPLHLLFKREIQYVVPLYQRPYVWREATHWAPLWDDVLGVARQVSEQRGVAQPDVAPHFLGAVVLEEQRGSVTSVERRYVIDGQQRLTTLQLLLAAGASVAEAHGFGREGRQLRSLVENDEDYVIDDHDVFKVWPTNIDRAAFRAVMGQREGWEIDDPFNLVQEAFSFFRRIFEEQLADLDNPEGESWFSDFVLAVRNYIQLVVIDLEERDNPQVIFETLNARGTPLLAIDLVKNLLLHNAQRTGLDVEELYKRHWRILERARWREEVRQGRLVRPRAEIFLMHWLTMKRRDEVLAHQLYNSFRVYATSASESAADLIAELASDARLFESFDQAVPGSPEHRFFRTLMVLDTSTVLPVVLALYKARLPQERVRATLAALESWLVRRMLCGLTPKNYNRFILELLGLADQNPKNIDHVVIGRLRTADAETNRWPSDSDVVGSLARLRFYGRLSQPRARYVLTAIERALRTNKTEDVDLPGSLTVEHVMPQSWEDHWPLSDPADYSARAERNDRVQRLGNLTLLTSALNAASSNAAWSVKRMALDQHSVLLLNRELIHRDEWRDDDIDERSERLARVLCDVWPSPHASFEGLTAYEPPEDPAPEERESPLSPEELINRFGMQDAVPLMLQFVEEVSYWDGVRIRVGKAKQDQWRRIYFTRRGSPYGAFCRIYPPRGGLRLRLDIGEVPFAKNAEALAVQDPYRVRLRFKSQEDVSEALALARRAWDQAIADEALE